MMDGRRKLQRLNYRATRNDKGVGVKKLSNVVVAASLAFLSGCATMQSHDSKVGAAQASAESGSVATALQQLEASATSDSAKKELLFNLERGELLRLAKRYSDSTAAYMLADEQVKTWEDTAKTSPDKLLGNVGAAILSERLKSYEGQDYEKVMLTTRLALNRMAVGDWDNARVDVKRTHEREAVIAELRAKELVAAEEEAKKNGAKVGGKELNGYPVETLEDPAVLALKNGYQNALSHYLSGFLYEVLNEPGLAAPGYRKAIELNPNAAILEEGLRGLDQRTSFTHRRRQKMTDVLFLVEAGSAPARKSTNFSFPVPTGRGIVSVSVAYPVIQPSNSPYISSIGVANTQVKTQPVVDFNVMARRALKDEMPAMLMRSATRAIVKGVVQDQAQKKLGLLGGLVTAAASIVTEQADDRMWRMLPERVYVARAYLPPGTHKISIDGRELPEPVVIDGQYALVPVRVYTNNLVVGDVASFGKLAATAVAAPEPAKPAETTRVMSTTTRSSTATSGARSNRATAPATANTGTAKSAPTVAPKPAPAATTPAAKPAVKPAGGVPTKAPAP
jgi:hypothetical protein